jgi:hypothetical protein
MPNGQFTSPYTPPFNPQDPNIFSNLRFGNIFRPDPEGVSSAGRVDPLYGPPEEQLETSASDKFAELLANYPEAQAPGMLKKIALSMIGMSDPALASKLGSQPGQEEIDWLNQMELAKLAAELEQDLAGLDIERGRLGLGKERLAFDVEKLERESTPAEKQALEIERIDLRAENALELMRQRAEAARETNRVEHANTLDGIIKRAEVSSQAETQRQAGRTGLERERQTGRREMETERQRGRRELEEQRQTGRTERGRTPGQSKTALESKARRIISENPDLADVIEFTDEGPQVKEAKQPFDWWPFGGRTEEELATPFEDKRQKALRLLYGDESGQGLVPEAETGQIEVIDPNGDEGFIPANQLEEALRQGYTRVR